MFSCWLTALFWCLSELLWLFSGLLWLLSGLLWLFSKLFGVIPFLLYLLPVLLFISAEGCLEVALGFLTLLYYTTLKCDKSTHCVHNLLLHSVLLPSLYFGNHLLETISNYTSYLFFSVSQPFSSRSEECLRIVYTLRIFKPARSYCCVS